MSRPWKERLRRLIASTDELEAGGEIVEAAVRGTERVADCRARQERTLSGVLRAVRYSASGSRPELVGELYDGSGSVNLVWLGRHDIPGIEPGRRLIVTGRLTDGEDRLVMYNPAYTLLPPAVAS